MEATTELSFEEKVLRVARDRGTTAPDGPTPLMHFDVLEFHVARAKKAAEDYSRDRTSGNEIVAMNGFGQCLYDLIIQSHFQGESMGRCINERNLFAAIPPVWPLIDTYMDGLKAALETLPKGDPLTIEAIAQVHTCISAGSMTHLGRTPESCLDLVLEVVA